MSSSSSASTPNPWSPYDTYKDCSQGLCSIYCPQWCYLVFPPPPPFSIGEDDDDDSGTDFSPLIIAVIGILASAFILVSYYTIISKYCRRRRQGNSSSDQFNESRDELNRDGFQTGSEGLEESLIKSITVCKYKRSDGLIEGTDCSVCLSEFQEDENLRLLPKCNHAFHVPCIDTWLKSHSSCPLCRANVAFPPPPQTVAETAETPRNFVSSNVSALEYQQINEGVSVIHDLESGGGVREETVFVSGEDGVVGDGIFRPMRRSASMNVFSVADILRISEEEEDLQLVESSSSSMGIIGSSSKQVDVGEYCFKSNHRNGVFSLVRSPLAMKRSISTGRFMFSRHEKEKNSMLPN